MRRGGDDERFTFRSFWVFFFGRERERERRASRSKGKKLTNNKITHSRKQQNKKNRDKAVAWGCSGPQQQWKSGIAYGDQPDTPPPCSGPPAVVAPPVEEFRDCPGCFRQNWAGRVVTLSVDSWKMGTGGERE